MDLLVHAHRTCQKFVDTLGMRPIAQRLFRLLLKARYGNDGLIKAEQNGRTWLLVPEVALRGAYAEFETVEWLRRVIKPGDCVFDIGANVGQMTLEAAYLVGPTGKVIAVEPAPGNLRVLRRHVNANGFDDRVEILEAACGAVHGETITFHVYGESSEAIGSGHSVCHQDLSMQSFPITVPVVSIDRLASSWQPQVIKIDVVATVEANLSIETTGTVIGNDFVLKS